MNEHYAELPGHRVGDDSASDRADFVSFVGIFETLDHAVRASEALIDAGVGKKAIDIVDRASDAPTGTPGEQFSLSLDRWFPEAQTTGLGVGLFAGQTLLRVRVTADIADKIPAFLQRFHPIRSRRLT